MDNRTRAREFLDAPKRWLSWATLGNVSHAWERFPINALGVQPESRATVCGVESLTPAAWISGPGITRCPECARIEAEQLAAEFAAIRREALESAAKEAERQIVEYSEIDLLDPTPERLRIARRIRAIATPTKPGDETK